MAKTTSAELRRITKAHIPPKERVQFKQLVALNPNYFGNLLDSPMKVVKKMVGNTTYEQVSCLGFNPHLNLLEATVQIKLPGGYNGLLCSPGSTEYVRFYIDYGSGWEDAGLAAFNSHDIPNTLDCADKKDKPLSYVVTTLLEPKKEICTKPVLPRVRAILSWQVIPPAGQPNWPPVWGNVLDDHIQIKPRFLFVKDIIDLIPEVTLKKLPPYWEEIQPLPIPMPDPPPFELAKLAQLYSGKTNLKTASVAKSLAVEPHRFGFAHIQSVMAQGNQEVILSAMSEWKSLDLDWAQAVAVLDKTKADVSYEELECLGLEYNLDRLVATFRVKKPTGFSGGLCSKGSLEFVAFWADWEDTCDWDYLGTVTINTHDIPIPAGGLSYSAILPVDLTKVRQPCGGKNGGPKIARIRAVLSWNSPPSTTDPDALNHWGNRVDAHAQIKPGSIVSGDGPHITIIGGIGKDDIYLFGNGMTKSTAVFALYGTSADEWGLGRECPFGGKVIIQGPPVSGYKYRLWARKFGDATSEQIVKYTFHIVNNGGVGSFITPDPVTGYVVYMNESTNFEKTLAYWYSSGDELMEIRVEMATLADVVVDSTPWYSIQLDNTGPRRPASLPASEPPEITCEIHIASGGDCKDFTKGTLITGSFTARDEHFGKYALTTLPSSLSPTSPSPALGNSQTATFASGGNVWTLDTTGMTPCGYVILLHVWDRSIVGSQPGSHNYNYYDVGFCLRQK